MQSKGGEFPEGIKEQIHQSLAFFIIPAVAATGSVLSTAGLRLMFVSHPDYTR